jgi:hypothetical protein
MKVGARGRDSRRSSWRVLLMLGAVIIAFINAEGGFGKGTLYKYAGSFTPLSHLLVFILICVGLLVVIEIGTRIFIR